MQDDKDKAALVTQKINALAVLLEAYINDRVLISSAQKESFNSLLLKFKYTRTLTPAQACIQFIAWLKVNNGMGTSAEDKLEKELLETLKRLDPDEYFKVRLALLLEKYKKDSQMDDLTFEGIQGLLWLGDALSAKDTHDQVIAKLTAVVSASSRFAVDEKAIALLKTFRAELKKIYTEIYSPVSVEVLPSPKAPNKDAGRSGQEQSQNIVQAGAAFIGGAASEVGATVQRFFGKEEKKVGVVNESGAPQYMGKILTLAEMREAAIKDRYISTAVQQKKAATVEEVENLKKEKLVEQRKQHETIARSILEFIQKTDAALQGVIQAMPSSGIDEKKVDLESLRKKSVAYSALGEDEKKKKEGVVDEVAKTWLDRFLSFVPDLFLTKKYLDGLIQRRDVVSKSFSVIAQTDALQRAVNRDSAVGNVNWKTLDDTTVKVEFDTCSIKVSEAKKELGEIAKALEGLSAQRKAIQPRQTESLDIQSAPLSDILGDDIGVTVRRNF